MVPLIRILVPSLLAVLALSCSKQEASPDFDHHNLLVITIDTLRADRLGSYGHQGAQTPHLDRLASGGVRFESCHSSVPLTLPSHTTMFTGRYPFATKVHQNGVNFVSENETTLAELFRDAGFNTSATISAYVLTSKFGLDQGFDVYEDSLEMGDLFRFFSRIEADEVYERFTRWLQENGTDRFFSWVHFYDPHLPYEPPEPFLEQFHEEPYDGEIAFVDFQIGRILDDLERLGVLDNTLIVVTSDHGEAFQEHVEEGHGLMCYEQTLRVPLIFYAPDRLPAGEVVSEGVALVDLLPTLVDLFNLERPSGLQGRSLVDLLQGKDDALSRSIYFESLAGVKEKGWAPRTGLIAEEHKFIKVPEPELYNLAEDPGETKNLFRQRRDMAGRLDSQLKELLLSTEGEESPADRELTEEDRRHLSALGYLGSTSARSEGLIEPKIGIQVEMKLRAIRGGLDRGEFSDGERELDSVVRAYPDLDTSDFYELRYRIEEAKQNEAAAIAALEEGMAKFPDSTLIFTLAYYHRQLGNLEEAERLCRAILETRPEFSQAINLLGLIAEDRGDLRRALEFFEEASEFEPTSVPLRLKIADALARLGELDRGIELYESLLSAGALDNEAESLYKAATLLLMGGDLERAESLFHQGLELEPAGKHYISLAIVQVRAGRPEDAKRSMETALEDYRESLTPQEIQLAESTLQQWRGSQ